MEYASFPPHFTLPKGEKLKELIETTKDWALLNGIGMRSKTNFSCDSINFAPFTLLPSMFPRSEFEKAVEIQPILNELIHKVAHDHEFLSKTLKNTVEVDSFTKKLFDIYETVRNEGFAQPISLGIIRSDIMLEPISDGIRINPLCNGKQVEINTIASGFGWLGPASRIIHRNKSGDESLLDAIVLLLSVSLGVFRSDYMVDVKSELSLTIKQVEINTVASSFAGITSKLKVLHRFVLERLEQFKELNKLPENNALSGICEGILEAWKIYNYERAVILIVVEDIPYNICDQRYHEFKLYSLNPKIKVLRRTLSQLVKSGTLNENKTFFVDEEEVGVVYYRSGYSPNQYHTESEWTIRLLIEKSKAIKCPSIHYHLAGTKKVQQALAGKNVLKRFFEDENKIKSIEEMFTGLYSLDLDNSGDKAVQLALNNPKNYVLKPQREGGGNNVYGEEISKVLKEISNTKERAAFILMDRIRPPVQRNYIIKPGGLSVPLSEDVVSELGVFGVIIGTKDVITINKQVGHMLRTKGHSVNEGGVAAGSGSLDSPLLY